MEKQESPLHFVLGPEHHDHSVLHPTAILLHGRGADEEDLLGLAPYLDSRLLTVAVRAPYRFPYAGYTWYDVRLDGAPDPEQFRESYRRLLEFVDFMKKEYPVDPEKIFLFGFSMGAVMSFALSLTHPEMFRGIIAHSGYVPEQSELSFHWEDLGTPALFVAHGIHDPVVSVDRGRRAKELLSRTTARLTYKEYPIAHSISEVSLRDASQWLSRQIEGRSPT